MGHDLVRRTSLAERPLVCYAGPAAEASMDSPPFGHELAPILAATAGAVKGQERRLVRPRPLGTKLQAASAAGPAGGQEPVCAFLDLRLPCCPTSNRTGR